MAKTKAVYSEDATTLIFKGNPKKPECGTAIIKFPGGHVEVTRTSDSKYWAHLCVDKTAQIINSRMMYGEDTLQTELFGHVHDIPCEKDIKQMAVLVDGLYQEPGE
jgi:hypothetical protein